MDPQVKNDRAAWLQGPLASCSPVAERESPWRLVLLGAPGVGKGTQALLLSQHFWELAISPRGMSFVRSGAAPSVTKRQR